MEKHKILKEIIELNKKNFRGLEITKNFAIKGDENSWMIFSGTNEQYTKKECSEFKKYENKFVETPFKHRYYAYYKNKNNELTHKGIVYIMFNPSHATPEDFDDSITNCINLAKNYDYIEILNLFSLRKPSGYKKIELYASNDINEKFILDYLENIVDNKTIDVVLAWGHGKEKDYKEIIDEINNILKNKNNVFMIGVDAQKANTYIHHANSQIWNGLGKIEEVTKLVPYNLIGV